MNNEPPPRSDSTPPSRSSVKSIANMNDEPPPPPPPPCESTPSTPKLVEPQPLPPWATPPLPCSLKPAIYNFEDPICIFIDPDEKPPRVPLPPLPSAKDHLTNSILIFEEARAAGNHTVQAAALEAITSVIIQIARGAANHDLNLQGTYGEYLEPEFENDLDVKMPFSFYDFLYGRYGDGCLKLWSVGKMIADLKVILPGVLEGKEAERVLAMVKCDTLNHMKGVMNWLADHSTSYTFPRVEEVVTLIVQSLQRWDALKTEKKVAGDFEAQLCDFKMIVVDVCNIVMAERIWHTPKKTFVEYVTEHLKAAKPDFVKPWMMPKELEECQKKYESTSPAWELVHFADCGNDEPVTLSEEERKFEEERKLEEERQLEEERKFEEERQLEEERKLEEERQLEEKRKFEEERRDEEARKLLEAARKMLEEERKLEEAKKLEEARKLEEAKKLEAARKIEDKRILELTEMIVAKRPRGDSADSQKTILRDGGCVEPYMNGGHITPSKAQELSMNGHCTPSKAGEPGKKSYISPSSGRMTPKTRKFEGIISPRLPEEIINKIVEQYLYGQVGKKDFVNASTSKARGLEDYAVVLPEVGDN